MGRKRKNPKDNWLPDGVYRDVKGNRYIVRNKGTGGKEKRLCRLDACKSEVWQAYESFFDERPRYDALGGLCLMYLESSKFTSLAPRTQSDYRKYYTRLEEITFNGGTKLMDLPPARITKGVIRQILDLRAKEGAAVQGNRQVKGLLSAVFAWALERDLIKGVESNPCHGVERNKEKGRLRYVEDWELDYALKRARPDYLPVVMELCYLLFARIAEVIELTRMDLKPEGVLMRRRKGSKHNIVKWSPRLETAINKALGMESIISSVYVVHDKNGQPLRYATIRNSWDRTMGRCVEAAEKDGLVFTPFTRHDMKAKGVSDAVEGQNSAGHKSQQMQALYRRKLEQVEPPK